MIGELTGKAARFCAEVLRAGCGISASPILFSHSTIVQSFLKDS
jgi:hypothetical protein